MIPKKYILIGVAVLFMAVLLLPVTRDETQWFFATRQSHLTPYTNYLASWPNGRHKVEAQNRAEALSWNAVESRPSVERYREYLRQFPNGHHSSTAISKIEQLQWEAVVTANRVIEYDRFLQRKPDSRFASTAREQMFQRMQEVLWANRSSAFTDANHRFNELSASATEMLLVAREEVGWREATNSFTISALEAYLSNYGAGRHVAEARDLIEDLEWKAANTPPEPAAFAVSFTSGVPQHGPFFARDFEALKRSSTIRLAYERELGLLDNLKSYIATNRNGKYFTQAVEQLDFRQWAMATNAASDLAGGFFRSIYLNGQNQGPWTGKNAAEMTRLFLFLFPEVSATRATNAYRILCLSRYLQESPKGRFVDIALAELEELKWAEADCPRAILEFIAEFPTSIHLSDLRRKLAAMRNDDSVFLRLARMPVPSYGDVRRWKEFLADYPGHRRESEVRGFVDEFDSHSGRDVATLVSQGKVEVSSKGDGIRSVMLSLKRKSLLPVAVRIPAGTYFVSSDSSAQNMVTVGDHVQILWDDDWHAISANAACANRTRAIPGEHVSFTLRESAPDADITKISKTLASARASTHVAQAAVWIVTDDANFNDLGVLKGGPFRFRVINEPETAEAMKLVVQAGIEIKRKRIWLDRHSIASRLPNGELRNWLSE